MDGVYLIVAMGAIVAGFVQGISGFAFGLVAMSFWAWVLEPRLAATLAVFGALLGALLVLWCPAMLLNRRLPRIRLESRLADGAVGLAGGVLGGLGGFTGTLPTLWCTLRGFAKDRQRAVIQNFNLSMLLVAMGIHLASGLVTRDVLPLFAIVAPAMLLPSLLGARLYIGLSEARFRQVVLGLLTLSGLALLAASLPRLLTLAAGAP